MNGSRSQVTLAREIRSLTNSEAFSGIFRGFCEGPPNGHIVGSLVQSIRLERQNSMHPE
jgi:hypothetical protein